MVLSSVYYTLFKSTIPASSYSYPTDPLRTCLLVVVVVVFVCVNSLLLLLHALSFRLSDDGRKMRREVEQIGRQETFPAYVLDSTRWKERQR